MIGAPGHHQERLNQYSTNPFIFEVNNFVTQLHTSSVKGTTEMGSCILYQHQEDPFHQQRYIINTQINLSNCHAKQTLPQNVQKIFENDLMLSMAVQVNR